MARPHLLPAPLVPAPSAGDRMSLEFTPWAWTEDFPQVPVDRREVVRSMVVPGGRDVRVQTEEQWADLSTEPFTHYPTCRYETVVTVYRVPPEKPYEAGPVPGSLW